MQISSPIPPRIETKNSDMPQKHCFALYQSQLQIYRLKKNCSEFLLSVLAGVFNQLFNFQIHGNISSVPSCNAVDLSFFHGQGITFSHIISKSLIGIYPTHICHSDFFYCRCRSFQNQTAKQKRACVFIIYYSPKAYVSRNPRVLDTRQTENLGGIGTLRWRNRECNNSPFVVSY